MSDTIEDRVKALERRIADVRAEAHACVQELLVDDDARFLIAERLPALGSAALPAVHELLAESTVTAEVRALAALVGFAVGDRGRSLEALIDEITARSEFAPLVARRLGSGRVRDAVDPILAALRETEPTDVDAIVSYLEALHDLGARLPEDEKRRLDQGGAWQVKTAIAQWYSADPRTK